MSELINSKRRDTRWELFSTVSAMALIVALPNYALAGDNDRPAVWIELGGQMEGLQGTTGPFVAPFMELTPTPGSV